MHASAQRAAALRNDARRTMRLRLRAVQARSAGETDFKWALGRRVWRRRATGSNASLARAYMRLSCAIGSLIFRASAPQPRPSEPCALRSRCVRCLHSRFLLLEEEQLRSQPDWVASTLSHFLQLPKMITANSIVAVASNHTNHAHAPVVGEVLRRTLTTFYDSHAPHVRAIFEDLAPAGSNWAHARWLHPQLP